MDQLRNDFLLYCFLITHAAMLLSQPSPSHAIILCDGDCVDNVDLDICRPFNDSKKPIYVMAFFPCNTGTFRARGFTVAAQMAIRAVQRSNSILQDYSLRLAFNNTKCDRLSATRAFINQLGDIRHMIIGPGCSSGAVTVGQISPFYNLTQISYTATSISLSDKRQFPNFVRTISSDNASIDTITSVVREYEWETVAIVTEISELYSNLTTVLNRSLENVRVLTDGLMFDREETDLEVIIQHLNTSGARVVVLNVLEDTARKLFCLAYHYGMIFPNYLFISYYQYSEFWWIGSTVRNFSRMSPQIECGDNELTEAIYRSLAVDYFPMPTTEEENNTTDVGYDSPIEFWNDFLYHLESLNYNRSEALRQAMYVYDAVWTAAFALDNASKQLKNGLLGNVSLEDFDYTRSDINNVLLNSVRSVKFRGVSGKVKLNQYGDREPTRQVFQYTYKTIVNPEDPPDPPLKPFARVNEETRELVYEPGKSVDDVFPGDVFTSVCSQGRVNGVPRTVEEVFVSRVLFVFYTILACLGIVFAVACLVFNLAFKEKKIVKLSSPYLNVLIIVGAILFYIDVILFGIDQSVASYHIVDINCQATIWLASIGFSLLFGTMLAKTWRVYYIFRSVKLKKKPMKDWILFLIVAVIVAVDVVFLIIVTVDKLRLRLVPEMVIRQGGAIPQVVGICESDAATIWIPMLLAYKGLYLVVGVWLAVTTYRVRIKQLRDSKLIVACVSGISAVSLVLTLITYLIPTNPNATYGVVGSCIWVLLTSVLFLLFVTRMIELYLDFSGEVDITSGPKGSNEQSSAFNNVITADDKVKISELKQTIESLKTQIAEAKERQLSKLQEATEENEMNQEINPVTSEAELLGSHGDDSSKVAERLEMTSK